ncbi:MAG: phosphatidylglycerol lysyltransferase domain-containing protein [Mycobacterium sp.]
MKHRDASGDERAERVVLKVRSPTARFSSAVALFGASCWLVLLLARNHHHLDWHSSGQLAWWMAILAAVALIARGILLGRPVTAGHAAAALATVSVGLGAHVLSLSLLGNLLIAAAGLVLMWPTRAPAQPGALPRVWTLVTRTHGDPLAPFTMQRRKSYHFNADDTAVIAYRTLLGFAVVSGDPIGEATRLHALVADFAAMCRSRGWRIVVLGCSQRRLRLWSDPAVIGQDLRPIPIGRDVVINVAGFHMDGRKFRNLRQAVQRTHNAGITTTVVAEADLDETQRGELSEVIVNSPSGARTERGFSMILDGALHGGHPGIELIIARDREGRVQGFHRYTVAGAGSDVSLEAPWRRRNAPNGIDERLSVDMIRWARAAEARRLSLAFAPFPEIFHDKDRGPVPRLLYLLIHLGDAFIRLESLYRYLRKFNALGARRYVLVSMRQLLPALGALLILEFAPRRRHLPVAADGCLKTRPLSSTLLSCQAPRGVVQ